MRGPFIVEERWGVLRFVNDPHVQSLEYAAVPCGNCHPPVRLDWKEGSLKGVRELHVGAHAVRWWTPFAATWLPPVSMPPMRRSKCPKTGTRRGMTRGTPALLGQGAAHIVGTAPARFPRVPHTLAIAMSLTTMGHGSYPR